MCDGDVFSRECQSESDLRCAALLGRGVSCGWLPSAGENLPVTQIAQDAWLRRTKIFCAGFENAVLWHPCHYPHLYVYNDEYLYPVRALLNHKNGGMDAFACQQRKAASVSGFVNYISDNNGFSLRDLFCYEQKHNEENGEENRDGSDWNLSANYGVEDEAASSGS